jgi:hypothetical protein
MRGHPTQLDGNSQHHRHHRHWSFVTENRTLYVPVMAKALPVQVLPSKIHTSPKDCPLMKNLTVTMVITSLMLSHLNHFVFYIINKIWYILNVFGPSIYFAMLQIGIQMILVSWICIWNPHSECGFQIRLRIQIQLLKN